MHSLVTPSPEPDDGAVHKSTEPQEHIDQINPDGVLHPLLSALVWSWMCWDIDFAENTEKGSPEDATRDPVSRPSIQQYLTIPNLQKGAIPGEEPPTLQERNAINDGCHSGEASDDLGKDPLAICSDVRVVRSMKIDTVKTGDCDGQYELEKADDSTSDRTECAA